jgi:hypothetical protein
MDIFYIIVLVIAIVILILILTFIGIKMTDKKASSTAFPPVASTCPDYWKIATDGKSCEVQTSGKNKITIDAAAKAPAGYSSSPLQIDFTNTGWSEGGASSVCKQKTWANSNNIVWDGITNYNKC